MFGMLKDKMMAGANKFAGNTDYLEAVCAGVALGAASEGGISEQEEADAKKAISANESITKAFNSRQIDQCLNKMFDKAEKGRSGRAELFKELEDIADNADMAEAVMLAVLDVVEGDGTISDAERAMCEKIATRLGVNLTAMLDV